MGQITDAINDAILTLKGSGINGCITGSSMIPGVDFDTWDQEPDVDVFVYSEGSFIDAIDRMMFKYGFEPGVHGHPESRAGEEWKIQRTIRNGLKRDAMLTTVKLNNGKVTVNVSYRKYQTTMIDVLSNFDMSIIMIGYDIPTGMTEDMRCRQRPWDESETTAKMTARPNPYRDQDADMYTTSKWIRQFDRVIKYWNRGFDTRPMAEFYIKLIDDTLKTGAMFQTEKSIQFYNEFASEFEDVKKRIELWLEDKKEV